MGMRLNLFRVDPAEVSTYVADPMLLYTDDVWNSERYLDLDKAWDGLHFLFTGTRREGAPPEAFLLVGETEFGEGVIDYGGHVLEQHDVTEFAAYLEETTADELRSRFDPNRMTELAIYPDIWDRDPEEDDTLGYLLRYFDFLRDFVSEAADERQATLVWLS